MFKIKTSQQIVAEIHNEFDTAQDRLLAEADDLLKSLNIETENQIKAKATRLENLGFKNAAPVKWVTKSPLIKTREEAELIRYYKQVYPFQKFLTEKELERICTKYKLVFAPVENYIKDVPENNLKEIEGTKPLASKDKAKDIISCFLKKDNRFFLCASSGGDWAGIWGSEWYKIPSFIQGKHFYSQYNANSYLQEKLGFKTEYLISSVKNVTIDKQGLFICAPQKDFDLKSLKKTGKYSFMNISVVPVKDPIVFRYCKGGIQVLSKWGLEAGDEMLVNEIYN